MKIYYKIEKIFKVQKWIKGEGWTTIGISIRRWEAEMEMEKLRRQGMKIRLVEEEA